MRVSIQENIVEKTTNKLLLILENSFNWIEQNSSSFEKLLFENMKSNYGANQMIRSKNMIAGGLRIEGNIILGQREKFSDIDNYMRRKIFAEKNIQILPFNRIGEIMKKKRDGWSNYRTK